MVWLLLFHCSVTKSVKTSRANRISEPEEGGPGCARASASAVSDAQNLPQVSVLRDGSYIGHAPGARRPIPSLTESGCGSVLRGSDRLQTRMGVPRVRYRLSTGNRHAQRGRVAAHRDFLRNTGGALRPLWRRHELGLECAASDAAAIIEQTRVSSTCPTGAHRQPSLHGVMCGLLLRA